jgi:hypothetical protein
MWKPLALVVGVVVAWSSATTAQAAKTYDDPWLEGDLQQMRVPLALDTLARVPAPVIVGDIDSGARLSDPDLKPHLVKMTGPYSCVSEYEGGPSYSADPANGDFGCDFVGNGLESVPTTNPDGDPTDPYGHGTGTAEIIAGVPNNGVGGAGVAPNARVLPVRACYGGGPDCYNEPAFDGLTYAVAMGATVINASWPPEDLSQAETNFVHGHLNVLFVFAIGGSGQNAQPYPLCTDKSRYPNVICVGLANADDSAGTVDADATTDVSAPGYAGVPSAAGARAEFGYTSGATAHVTGAAAVLRGLAPDLSPSAIRQVLVSTSRQVAGYATANKAHGIVDLAAAVRSVQQSEGLVTPVEGHGAAPDATNPFAGQAPPATDPGTPVGTTPTAPATTTPTPAPATPPAATPTLLAISLTKPPTSVRAGTTLTLHVRVTGGSGTVTAKLTHGKKTLAKATKKAAAGNATLKLRVPRAAKTGKATLTVQVGSAKAQSRPISVKRHR